MVEAEEVTEIPLVYPLVSVTLKSVSIVNGNAVLHECEEVIDVRRGMAAKKKMSRLVQEFKGYVQKVIESAQSQQGRDALQNIRDTHSQGQSPPTEGPPSSPGAVADLDPRN